MRDLMDVTEILLLALAAYAGLTVLLTIGLAALVLRGKLRGEEQVAPVPMLMPPRPASLLGVDGSRPHGLESHFSVATAQCANPPVVAPLGRPRPPRGHSSTSSRAAHLRRG